jgi:dolichyl-phosphate beta-glucosyltransferase
MHYARGERLLFADADGASNIDDLSRLEMALEEKQANDYGIAIGSRAHLVGTQATVNVSLVSQSSLQDCPRPTVLLLLNIY